MLSLWACQEDISFDEKEKIAILGL